MPSVRGIERPSCFPKSNELVCLIQIADITGSVPGRFSFDPNSPGSSILAEEAIFVVQKLEEVGWPVNRSNSLLEPTQCLPYLGII